jgi:hypothetical protein
VLFLTFANSYFGLFGAFSSQHIDFQLIFNGLAGEISGFAPKHEADLQKI